MKTSLPARAHVQTALDRRANLFKILTWAGLLLAGSLYMVGIFGPLKLLSPSLGPKLMLNTRALTLVRDTDATRAVPESVLNDQGARRLALRPNLTHSLSQRFAEIWIASLAPTVLVG